MFVRAVHATKSVILRRSGAEYALLVCSSFFDSSKVRSNMNVKASSPSFSRTDLARRL